MSKQGRRRKLDELAAQEATRAKRAKTVRFLAFGVIGLLVAGLVTAVAMAVTGSGDPTPGAVAQAKGATKDGAVIVGQVSAPVTVALYYDYMCPACGQFERANGTDLKKFLDDGTIKLELRPLVFLDRASQGTGYSTRTANALYTVAAEAPEFVWAFHASLYEHQPQENTPGLTDEQIAQYATEAGVPADVVAKFAAGTYRGFAQKVGAAGIEKVQGTPTVYINGAKFEGDVFNTGPLSAAIQAAANQ